MIDPDDTGTLDIEQLTGRAPGFSGRPPKDWPAQVARSGAIARKARVVTPPPSTSIPGSEP